MARILLRAGLVLGIIAYLGACNENCEQSCSSDYDDCVHDAQTADKKAACHSQYTTCIAKCPQNPAPPGEAPAASSSHDTPSGE